MSGRIFNKEQARGRAGMKLEKKNAHKAASRENEKSVAGTIVLEEDSDSSSASMPGLEAQVAEELGLCASGPFTGLTTATTDPGDAARDNSQVEVMAYVDDTVIRYWPTSGVQDAAHDWSTSCRKE